MYGWCCICDDGWFEKCFIEWMVFFVSDDLCVFVYCIVDEFVQVIVGGLLDQWFLLYVWFCFVFYFECLDLLSECIDEMVVNVSLYEKVIGVYISLVVILVF